MPDIDYNNLIETNPAIKKVLPENVLEAMKETDKKTRKHLSKLWTENIKYNVKHHLKKYGWLNDGFADFGRQKAVIAIGGGPSFNKNKDFLKLLSLTDGTRPLEEQDFILMASNHQLKPCLEMGIIPHFAIVADASPHLKSQMDVGRDGQHTILIASIIVHPKVIEAWKGPVKFIAQQNEQVRTALNETLGKEFDKQRCVIEGGNILNLSFMLTIGLFRAPVWMCVGNDLSFPIAETIEERRKVYYADQDYSTNIKSSRDEASYQLAWAGFEFPETPFITPRDYVNLKLVYTSPQMFIYKIWLETNAIIFWNLGMKFKIYNCSEGGILGVNLKEKVVDPDYYDEKFDPENWILMDEITGQKWRTRKLQIAAEEFHKAKEILNQWKVIKNAQDFTGLYRPGLAVQGFPVSH